MQCIPNIGPRQRRRRLTGGLFFAAATVLVAAGLVGSGAPRGWRVLVALPAAAAAIGIFQARAQTCVALVRMGVRNMGGGNERVADDGVMAAMRAQSRRVYVQTAVAAALVTALVLVL
jgi:hypothetical protein